MTVRLGNPFPMFFDAEGKPLHNGFIYMGEPGQDPETHPVDTFFDDELTIEAEQPLRTRGGYIVDGANPAFVYADGEDYSMRVRDVNGGELLFIASIAVAGEQYQPLDSDLTAIAALATTTFGRNLLTLANQAALKSALGYVEPVPAVGGNVTGNITRQGAGPHMYHVDGAMTSGRVFLTTHDAADPTSQPGDTWRKKVAP